MKIRHAFAVSGVGLVCSALGGYCNLAVERANNGDMPVFVQGCYGRINANHLCGQASTQLAGLSDWILFGNWLYSPGDILLTTGKYVTIAAVGLVVWIMLLKLIDHALTAYYRE